MTIGQNIRTYRKKRGLSQTQLAERIGMTGGAISIYESGSTIPKRKILRKIADALEVPLEKIVEDPPPVPRSGPEPPHGLLYDGVLTVLKELYGMVEGRVIMGPNGACKTYYVIHQAADSFVLYEKDIAAIVQSTRAALPPLAAHMTKLHSEQNAGASG